MSAPHAAEPEELPEALSQLSVAAAPALNRDVGWHDVDAVFAVFLLADITNEVRRITLVLVLVTQLILT
jgi:hypothetical protein